MDERDASQPRVTFGLVPGAGGDAWYWHRLVSELEARGHEAVAVELPAADDTARLDDYVEAIVEALAGKDPLALVAQSMGGLSAPLVCARRPVELLVLVNAMIPVPGETGAQWWPATGQPAARARHAAAHGRAVSDEVDAAEDFLHDLPPEVLAGALRRGQPRQSGTPFADPFPLSAWPDVPTRVIAGRDDRFFPATFQRDIARKRLDVDVEEIAGGHLLALANPTGLADSLCAAWSQHIGSRSKP